MKNRILFSLVMSSLFLFFSSAIAASTSDGLLKLGMSGNEVTLIQTKLQQFGFYQGALDGQFGNGTREAVIEFQVDCGLDADGVVGAETLAALRDYKPSSSRAMNAGRKGLQIVNFARQYLGVPYVWAGRGPSGFDCSGFIYYVYEHFQVDLPRMADEQYEIGQWVSQKDLLPGDLVFFSTYEPGPSHVGIYIGSGQFIHASSGAEQVTITPLAKGYYQERYLGAKRVIR